MERIRFAVRTERHQRAAFHRTASLWIWCEVEARALIASALRSKLRAFRWRGRLRPAIAAGGAERLLGAVFVGRLVEQSSSVHNIGQ